MNCVEVSNSNAKTLEIETEQKKSGLTKSLTWIKQECNNDLTYASLELTKY